MADYLLDTTALIDYLKGRPRAVGLIQGLGQQGHRLGVCCINITELYAGLDDAERRQADLLIDNLTYFAVTPPIAKLAGEYRYRFARQGSTSTTTDATIAATALAYRATLVTANVRDFPIPELSLLELPSGAER